MKKRIKKAFTLVELLVVIAILAVLSTVTVIGYSSFTSKAQASADEQAVTQMNKLLQAADITDDVESILNVYDLFDDSGLEVEDYTPLYKGRTFYYDTEYNQILYVDDATGKVLYPSAHEGETQGNHVWYSLNMEIKTTKIAATTTDEGATKYAPSTAGEYAYVVEELNKSYTANSDVIIELQNDIDLMGAFVTVESIPDGASFKLTSAGDATYTLKNITANSYLETGSTSKDSNRKYVAAGLVGKVEDTASVSITNVNFENINVKDVDAGNVALLIGVAINQSSGSTEIKNVTIKNSTVIGHRSVGALVGMLYSPAVVSDVTFENVSVQTIAGRSGLVFGFVSQDGKDYSLTNFVSNNSSLSIYECDRNTGTDCSIVDYSYAGAYNTNATKQITSYSVETNGTKEYRTYGFNENAVCCIWNGNAIDGSPLDNIDCVYRYCTFVLFN